VQYAYSLHKFNKLKYIFRIFRPSVNYFDTPLYGKCLKNFSIYMNSDHCDITS